MDWGFGSIHDLSLEPQNPVTYWLFILKAVKITLVLRSSSCKFSTKLDITLNLNTTSFSYPQRITSITIRQRNESPSKIITDK